MSLDYKSRVLRSYMGDKPIVLQPEHLVAKKLIKPDWYSIYDGEDEKILAVFNKKKRVMRINADSPLVQMLQDREGWAVVGSRTLDKYEGLMEPTIRSVLLEKVAQSQVEKILEAEDKVEVDLVYKTATEREQLLYRILDRIDPVDAVKGRIVYNACRHVEHRKYVVPLTAAHVGMTLEPFEMPF